MLDDDDYIESIYSIIEIYMYALYCCFRLLKQGYISDSDRTVYTLPLILFHRQPPCCIFAGLIANTDDYVQIVPAAKGKITADKEILKMN